MRRKSRRKKRLLSRMRKVAHIVNSFKKEYQAEKNRERLAECLKDPTLTDEALYALIREKLAAADTLSNENNGI